ncbi:spermidine/putrescine ABC transporter permease/substrate-binding protein [[Acholeplasma] multilocale]|uniref:spermidine/putrescine ABC transporter permease/substrate-binding protein n=1 Tax=[Acholeplasma] multilocale TaxID=264638 RepID=UPI00047A909D|nr:spermidine/putrescine ABC transporter permease/substrate-binding protein [[Acholeplasma] multilocale]
MKRFFKGSYFAIIMAFIYIPIVVMVIFSFNAGSTTTSWSGFDFKWYDEFIHNSPFIKSIITSLFVAVISTAVSVVIGTMAAIGLSRTKRVTQSSWFGVANIPLINADVVTAVSLMIIFLLSGFKFGLGTLIMAHVSFNVPYVLITVMPRLRKIDKSLVEASMDLGAKPLHVLFKVILPILKPAIITATAIAFAMSFDDFIISYFTGGNQTNVSTFIYTAKKIKPFIFAFGTILVGVIVLSIIAWNAITVVKQKRLQTEDQIKKGFYKAKKIQRLNKELDELYLAASTKTEIRRSRRISLWAKYYWLKLRIKIATMKNYDAKIAKLEWRQYKLKSEISKEKRYESRLKKANKKMRQLIKQLEKEKLDVKKAAKISIQIEKLQDKVEFLEEEIEWMKDRDAKAAIKVKKIQKQIKDLQKELKNEDQPSKKTIAWYNRKIKDLEDWKIEVEEGKNHYKLRMLTEKLKEVRDLHYNYVSELTLKSDELEKSLYTRRSITRRFDSKISKSNDILLTQELINEKNDFLKSEHAIYMKKIANKESTIAKVKNKVDIVREKLFPSNPDEVSHTKGFIARSWRVMLATLLGVAAFTGLTVAYVMNNIYDLVVANWGEYIDPRMISEFEKRYDVKINYQEYDSNETLYNKLFTFTFDVMVPSDYMVQKLANENRLLKLDYSKLNIHGTVNGQELNPYLSEEDRDEAMEIDSSLLDLMNTSKVHPIDEQEQENHSGASGSILDYASPYFWGDLSIIVLPTESNIKFLEDRGVEFVENEDGAKIEIKSDSLSWSILWDAAEAGKRVALNNDPKNIFMLGAQKVLQQVNLEEKQEVDQVKKEVAKLVQNKNVALNGDDLITKAAEGNFDFAVMYNGDAAYANTVYNGEDIEDQDEYGTTRFIYGRPNKLNEETGRRETTNVFSENAVISSESSNQDLAYKFLNFLSEKAYDLTEYVGIASPFGQVMEEMIGEDGTYEDYGNLYKPITTKTDGSFITGDKPLAYGLNPADDYLVNEFNNIISGKFG